VVDDDLRAVVGEEHGLAAADAVAGAGDDRDLAVEDAHLRVLPSRSQTVAEPDVGVTVPPAARRASRRPGAQRMAVDTSVIGKPTGAHRVRIERGPIGFFASAVLDDNPVYRDPSAA